MRMVPSARRSWRIHKRCANEFAEGITLCAHVHDDGRSWQGIGAAYPWHLDSLRNVANSFHSGGRFAILQLYDGGRIADPKFVRGELLRAPSPMPSLRPGTLIPREISDREIESKRPVHRLDLVDRWAA